MIKVVIAIPAYNEEKILVRSIKQLYHELKNLKKFYINVIIAENGSKDTTYSLAKSLEKKYPQLKALHYDVAGRDNAVQETLKKASADVFIFLDADMSTNPKHVKELIEGILEGYDLVVGSRMIKGAKVEKPFLRKIMSLVYNYFVIPALLPTGVLDSQCGFKAVNRKVINEIFPKLTKGQSFMDTEMLAVARSKGYKIKEIPIEWKESDRKSTMNVYSNIFKYIVNIFQVRKKIREGYY